MKNFKLFALLAAVAMVSCSNTYEAKTVELASQADSINYYLAYINGYQIRMQGFRDVDSTEVDEAIAAFMDAYCETIKSNKELEEPSHISEVGDNIGDNIKTFETKGLDGVALWGLNEKLYFAGMAHGMAQDTTVLTSSLAMSYLQSQYQYIDEEAMEGVKAPKAKKAKLSDKVKSVKLKNQNDSINFASGYYMGSQVKLYLLANDSDGAAKKEFIAAVNHALKNTAKFPQLAKMGQQYAAQIKSQEAEGLLGIAELVTDYALLEQGFINGFYQYEEITPMEINEYLNAAISAIRYGKNIAEGEAFLASKEQEEGVQKTESGLLYKVIAEGKGKRPTTEDRVRVHYEGTLIDGTVFDSSYQRGEPIEFDVTGVIAGWTEALQLMTVGSTYELYIPYNLAYGEHGAGGNIAPYATLIFKVELLDIVKK